MPLVPGLRRQLVCYFVCELGVHTKKDRLTRNTLSQISVADYHATSKFLDPISFISQHVPERVTTLITAIPRELHYKPSQIPYPCLSSRTQSGRGVSRTRSARRLRRRHLRRCARAHEYMQGTRFAQNSAADRAIACPLDQIALRMSISLP